MRAVHRGAAALAVGLGVLLVPESQTAPTAISLVQVEEATAVDFGDGVVWVLALGADEQDNADAIELIALNFESGAAAAIGIPRDTKVDLDGFGEDRINAGLRRGDRDLMVTEVEQLTGITPHYVVTTTFGGFEDLVDTVGLLTVHSDVELTDRDYDLDVVKGTNEMNGLQATGFARSRDLPGNDFDRMANQQRLLEAILGKLRTDEETEGFIESGALAALRNLDTDLSPIELYRFAQAMGQVDTAQTTTCVITGVPTKLGAADVIDVDEAYVQRVAADAADGVIETSCTG